MRTIDLAGRFALVTGGGQGIGAAISRTLAAAGAAVAVNYLPEVSGANKNKADHLAYELGNGAISVPADVSDPESVHGMFRDLDARFGPLDIIVNNAGILRDRSMKKMSDEEWRSVIDTNLTGVFHVCRRAAAGALRDGGRIVSISSIAGIVGFFGQSNYAAAKAGVIALTKVLSRELGQRNITVNAVAPGVVLTSMGRSIPEEVRAGMLGQIPLRRFGDEEEVADAVLFLCSDMARYITGQTLQVNGGWTG